MKLNVWACASCANEQGCQEVGVECGDDFRHIFSSPFERHIKNSRVNLLPSLSWIFSCIWALFSSSKSTPYARESSSQKPHAYFYPARMTSTPPPVVKVGLVVVIGSILIGVGTMVLRCFPFSPPRSSKHPSDSTISTTYSLWHFQDIYRVWSIE